MTSQASSTFESTNPTFQIFRTPVSVRWSAIFGILSSLLFAFIAWMAYWQEDAQIGLWTLPLWLTLFIYWVRQAWICWKTTRLENDQIVIQMPLGRRQIDYQSITGVYLSFQRLRLTTRHGTVTMRGHADTLTRITRALEQRLAALNFYQAKPSDTPLPIRAWARWMASLLMGLFGLVILAVGIAGIVYVAPNREIALSDWLSQIAMAAIATLVGGGLVYMFTTGFVWCYSFGQFEIAVYTTVKKTRYNPIQIKDVSLQQEKVLYRRRPYTLHRLLIDFVDGQTLVVEPGAQNYMLEYNEIYEQYILGKLHDHLRYHYGEVRRQQESKF